MDERMLTTGEAARMLRVHPKTIQRWDRIGQLTASRAPSGRRLYSLLELRRVLALPVDIVARRSVAYCRVSSTAQRPDLENQRRVVQDFCTAKGLAAVEMVTEIGGGLNFKRKLFLKLIDDICEGTVSTLVIAHRDRLARFGFDLMAHICAAHDCTLLTIDNERGSPEAEMVQDLMTIVHCFSSRLYGLRNYRKSLKAALENK